MDIKSTPLIEHPASLPKCHISESVDHADAAKTAVQRLALGPQSNELADNVIWRDSLAFTGTFRTFYGTERVMHEWEKLSRMKNSVEFEVVRGSSMILRLDDETCWIQAAFSFSVGEYFGDRCSGTIGLVPSSKSSDSGWEIWLLCTVLEQPWGWPNVDRLLPAPPLSSKHILGQATCQQHTNGEPDPVPGDQSMPLDCMVVGAGIGGLCMAGRLKALDLSYVVVEKDEVGDVWSKGRYDSVRLHTSKQYNQLPGDPPTFDKDHPYLLTAKDLSDGFQRYVDTFDINVMTSTCFETAKFDEQERVWRVQLRQDGKTFELKTRHIVLSIGDMGVKPKMPRYRDQHLFQGSILHSVNWKNASQWAGCNHGIVIGSANSAHDIISDMSKSSFRNITLFQRSKTFVLPGSTFSALVDPVYNESTPLDQSDRALLSLPLPIQRLAAMAGISACADMPPNPEKFDKMQQQGFKVRRYGDLWGQIYDSQGKHFFDIGAGDLIAEGKVKVISDALPVAFTEKGLVFDDGSEIEDVDVVVFATGYESHFRSVLKDMFGSEVAKKLRPFWGTDAEGEVLGAWRRTGCHGIWYTGHGFAHARYYSRFVAMQIKADVMGRPFEAYEAEDE
ncbi:putative indole-3-pyruvate monooxygenase YUCCA8 [Pseudocercospora fuligena]|uniref:Putative indole-3-pyruvate monooxygenase YUCCA8 n=1 Tax=Pseudocercospora fuligena TaxID=685502 RepID=A0A8H6RE06_9PEZI|nr:putative indole-3-pyruvate monooxygenase YUCCA8 [Pseudocercospora fuligena]